MLRYVFFKPQTFYLISFSSVLLLLEAGDFYVHVNETFWDSNLRLPFKASPMIKQILFSDVLPKGWLCMAQIHITHGLSQQKALSRHYD